MSRFTEPIALVARLCWRASPPLTLAMVGAVLFAGLLPVAFTLVTGAVVGAVLPAVRSGLDSAAGNRLLGSLALMSAIFVLQTGGAQLMQAVSASLGSRFALELRRAFFDATLSPPGIAHLEDPDAADDLEFVRGDDQRLAAETLVHSLGIVVQGKVMGIGSAVVLASLSWWAPWVLLGSGVLGYRWVLREVQTYYASLSNVTPGLRRASYLRTLAVEPAAAKEVRVFGLPRWIVDRYTTTWTAAMREIWADRRGHAGPMVQLAAGELVSSLLVYAAIARDAYTGRIGLGAATVFARAVIGTWALGPHGDDIRIGRGLEVLRRLKRMRTRLHIPAAALSGSEATSPVGDIAFEGVTFRYPGSDRVVLDGLSLHIPAGRSLAIVGLNGAGKTTMVKLLARLYDPEAGRITVAGRDLHDVRPEVWRRRIGIIFQDFVRFELSARANVGLGASGLMHDDAALTRAADKAGASLMIDGFPSGWDTILSRGYDGGIDLSGGQWQRIALARALMALEGGADVLVLDEPTANLDVRAEAALFDRFLDITAGATTILISHRFSSVRHADRIVVVERGRVVEEGTHADLLERDGRYARLFRLQAQPFASTVPGADDA